MHYMQDVLAAAIEAILKRVSPGYLSATDIAADPVKAGMPRVTAANIKNAIERDTTRLEMTHGSLSMHRRWERLENESSEARGILIRYHDVPAAPFGDFMQAVSLMPDNKPGLDGSYPSHNGVDWARRYLKAFTAKRVLLANTASKRTVLEQLAPVVNAANNAIVFTEMQEGAEAASERLESVNARAACCEKSRQPRRPFRRGLRSRHRRSPRERSTRSVSR